jgi:hypothetical protein
MMMDRQLKPSNDMQTNMNAFPALAKKDPPYASGRRPIRVMRGPSHGAKHFGSAIHELQREQYEGGLGAITRKPSHFL